MTVGRATVCSTAYCMGVKRKVQLYASVYDTSAQILPHQKRQNINISEAITHINEYQL